MRKIAIAQKCSNSELHACIIRFFFHAGMLDTEGIAMNDYMISVNTTGLYPKQQQQTYVHVRKTLLLTRSLCQANYPLDILDHLLTQSLFAQMQENNKRKNKRRNCFNNQVLGRNELSIKDMHVYCIHCIHVHCTYRYCKSKLHVCWLHDRFQGYSYHNYLE